MYLTAEQARERFPCAIICYSAIICEGAKVYGGADIHQGVVIHEGAVIHGGAVIYKGAEINRDVEIHKGAVIREGAEIHKGAVIYEGAMIGVGRKNVTASLVINGVGDTKNLTAYISKGKLKINIGCMNGKKGFGIKKTRAEIAKKYPDKSHPYYAALTLAENWYQHEINK